MDREVLLKVSGEEIHLGYVSDFLSPRHDDDTFSESVFDRIRDAIENLDLGGFDTEPIEITIS